MTLIEPLWAQLAGVGVAVYPLLLAVVCAGPGCNRRLLTIRPIDWFCDTLCERRFKEAEGRRHKFNHSLIWLWSGSKAA